MTKNNIYVKYKKIKSSEVQMGLQQEMVPLRGARSQESQVPLLNQDGTPANEAAQAAQAAQVALVMAPLMIEIEEGPSQEIRKALQGLQDYIKHRWFISNKQQYLARISQIPQTQDQALKFIQTILILEEGIKSSLVMWYGPLFPCFSGYFAGISLGSAAFPITLAIEPDSPSRVLHAMISMVGVGLVSGLATFIKCLKMMEAQEQALRDIRLLKSWFYNNNVPAPEAPAPGL